MNCKIGTVFLVIFVALAATEEDIEAVSVPVVPVLIQKQVSDVPGVILAIDKSVPSIEASGSSESSGEIDPSKEIQLESTESNRTTRSIGNIARLLLGGNVPPDHPLVKYPEPLQGSASTMQMSGSSNVIAAVPGMNNVPQAANNIQQNFPMQQQATSGTFQVPQFLLPNGGNNFQNPVQQPVYPQNGVNPQVPLMNNFQQQQALQYQQPGQFVQPQPQFNGQQQYQAPPPVQQFQTSAPGFNVGGPSVNSQDYSFAPQANLAQAGGNPYFTPSEPQPQGNGNFPPAGHANGGNPYQTNGAPYSPGGGVQYNSFSSPSTFATSSSNPQQQQPYEGSGPPYQAAPSYSNQPTQNRQNIQGGGQDPSYYSPGNNYLSSQPSATISESINLTPQYQQSQPQPQPQPQASYQQPLSGNNYQPPPPVNYNNPPPQQYNFPQQNNAFNVPQVNSFAPQPNFSPVPNQLPPSYSFNGPLGAPSTNTFTSAPGPSYPNINYNPNPQSPQPNAYNPVPQPQPNSYNPPPQQPQNYNAPSNSNSQPQPQQNPSSSVAYQPSNTYSNYQPQVTNSYSQPQPQSQQQSYQAPAKNYNPYPSSGQSQGQGGYSSQRQTPSSSPNYNAPTPNSNVNSNYNAPAPNSNVNSNSNYNAPGYSSNSSPSQHSYNAPNPQRSTAGLRNNYQKKQVPLTGKNYPRSKTALTNTNSNVKYNVPPKYNTPKDGQGRPKGEYDHLRYNANNAKKQSQKPVPFSSSYNANVDITYNNKAGVNYAPGGTSPSTYKSSLLASTGVTQRNNLRESKSMNLQRPPVSFKVPPSTTVTYNRYSKQTAPNPPGSAVKIYASKPNKHMRSQPRSYSSSAESSNPLTRLNSLLAKPPSHSTKRASPKA